MSTESQITLYRCHIEDFYKVGGANLKPSPVPQQTKKLKQYLKNIDSNNRLLFDKRIRVADIGPHGGMWTFAFLDSLKKVGIPERVDYFLYGTIYEILLTTRDSIAPFLYDIPLSQCLGHVHRVRSNGKQRLISEVKFLAAESNDLRPDPNNLRCNVVLAFDSIRFFTNAGLARIFDHIRTALHINGLFYFNVAIPQKALVMSLIKSHDFYEDFESVDCSGLSYFTLKAI